MKDDSPLNSDSRRQFVKKSVAASVIAAQPTILAGLLRADGGGGGETTTPWGTTVPETTIMPTTGPFGTTVPLTTFPPTTGPWETTVQETTAPPTTAPPTTAGPGFLARLENSSTYLIDYEIVEIDGSEYSFNLCYNVKCSRGNEAWSDARIFAYFYATLTSKMASDPQSGPFTGQLVGVGGGSKAVSKTLRYLPFVDQGPNAIRRIYCQTPLIVNGQGNLGGDLAQEVVYSVNGVDYRIRFDGIKSKQMSFPSKAMIARAGIAVRLFRDGYSGDPAHQVGFCSADRPYSAMYYDSSLEPENWYDMEQEVDLPESSGGHIKGAFFYCKEVE